MAVTVDDYVSGLSGWQADLAAELRGQIRAVDGVTETFKWGHPVYEAGGPVCLFKAHKAHLTLGFWRGQQMAALDPRLEPGGSFQMASIKLTGLGQIDADTVRRLTEAAVALNREHGDPLKIAKG